MKPYIQEPTETAPYLCFDPDNDHFEISGSSRPENVRSVYFPVIEWMRNFREEIVNTQKPRYHSGHTLDLSVKLEYFNSSSAKFIFDLFMEFNEINKKGIPIRILWYYDIEDEDMLDAGEEIAELAEMEFQFLTY